MGKLSADQLLQWLSGYKHSWEKQDADCFVALFTSDAVYLDRPFSEPVPAAQFRQFWTDLAQRQTGAQITFDVLGIEDRRAFVHWQASYTRLPSGEHRGGDGVFVLDFNDAGRCKTLREWQHWYSHSPASPPSQNG